MGGADGKARVPMVGDVLGSFDVLDAMPKGILPELDATDSDLPCVPRALPPSIDERLLEERVNDVALTGLEPPLSEPEMDADALSGLPEA